MSQTNSTYRTALPTQEASTTPSPENQTTDVTQVPTTVEAPLSEYESKHGKPYAVDYFDLGRYWDTGDVYTKEVGSISTYINHLVNIGEINNTVEAAQNKLKRIEKMINVDPEDRKASRVGRVAAYVEFLIKADNIKKDSAKYGMA